jgi:hypothetical protein
MKKLVLVLALVAVYGFAISNASAKIITAEKTKVTIVSDVDDNSSDTLKKEDKKKEDKKAPVTSVKKAPAKGCCGSSAAKPACPASAKKSCASAKKACGTAEKAPAKKACCGTK